MLSVVPLVVADSTLNTGVDVTIGGGAALAALGTNDKIVPVSKATPPITASTLLVTARMPPPVLKLNILSNFKHLLSSSCRSLG